MIKGSTKVGEIFICNKETNGKLEVLNQFLGRAITGFGGGYNKLFVLEEGQGYEGIISSLHPPENDIDKLFNDNRPTDENQEHIGRVKEENIMEFDDGGYQDDHQESEEANQEEINYINSMNEHRENMDEMGDYDEHHYTQGYPQDPNIQEYKEMHQNESDEDNVQFNTGRGNDQGINSPGSKAELGNTRNIQERMGQIKQIASSRNHILQLTRDGFVYSNGVGEFSVTGHGGSRSVQRPQILKHLSDKRVAQIACGEYHSLILTDTNDVYSWGRGYEGQLGVSDKVEIASKPSFVRAFFGVPVIFIACGSYYSLAITYENKLYGWGEARLGQLGLGVKTRIVRTPTYISVRESEDTVASKNRSSVSVKEENPKIDTDEAKIIFCSAGLGHTTAISSEGDLFVWGFNNWGQLGVGDHTTRWEPVRVEKDIIGNLLPQIQKAVCSYYSTYAIDVFGNLYSWGKGYLGHKNLTLEDLPRKIELNTENRYFTDVFANKDMVGFYAPIRIFSISPKWGPAYGGTLLSIIGTGFVYSDRLRVRFSYGNLNQEVSCTYEPKTKTLYCKTPKFQEFEGQTQTNLKFPCTWIISLTTDGVNYSEWEETFKIYSNHIALNSLTPKWGSVKGGAELTLLADIDPETAKSLFHLSIGFQPIRKRSSNNQASKKDLMQSSITKGQSIEETMNEDDKEGKQKTLNVSQYSSVKGSVTNIAGPGQGDIPINPLDITVNDPDLDSENWVCSAGHYENGRIIWIAPELDEYDSDNLQFNVDIALNGQQFTGHPLKFRYYDVNISEILPAFGPSEGGTTISLIGTGLYDSPIKRIKFLTDKGVREVTATWERKRKAIGCVVPPLTWLFGGQDVTEELIQEVFKSGVKVSLTFNNQEWIHVPDFRYHDVSVNRVAYASNFAEEIESEEEKQKLWIAEEPIQQAPPGASEEEIKKFEEEKAKRIAEEKEEVQTVAKRSGTRMYIYGSNFVNNGEDLKVKFMLGEKAIELAPIFKNTQKLAWKIPDMGEEIEVGQHTVTCEVTINGQNFTKNGKTFLYSAIDRNMSEEELKKLQEAEEKAKAKGGKKK